MKKILFVMPTDPLQAFYLKGEIKPRYYNPLNFFDEVHFGTFCKNDISEDSIKEIAGDARIFVHALGELWLGNVITMKKRLVRIVKEITPSVIRAYDPSIKGYLALCCGKKLGVPTVISVHNEYDEQRKYDKRPVLLLRKKIEKRVLINADVVIGVTEHVSNYARRYGARCVETVYNRVYNEQFSSERTGQVKKSRISILCVGRMVRQKYHECLLKAVRDIDSDITIIGDGPLYGFILSLVRKFKMEGRVKLIKSVQHRNIAAYYKSADIFAISTHYEGFCIPVLEAMASALPVVASDIGPIKEILGGCGMLVQNTPQEFEKAIKFLIENPSERYELGRKAKQRALLLDGSIMEKKEALIYRDILERKRNNFRNDLN